MNEIYVNATNSTPLFKHGKDGKLIIKGRSLPEDAARFYNPLITWAREVTVSSMTVEIAFEYINSASKKKLLELLKVLDANNHITDLNVNWFYEEGDDDSLENGQTFEELMLKARFRYHEILEVVQGGWQCVMPK